MPRSISVTELRERLEGGEAPVVLDVRRAQAFADSPGLIPGATKLAPEAVDAWAAELPKDRPVVAYCVLGHQVSQGVVARLEELGVEACFLEGGIEQWRVEGGLVSATDRESPVEKPPVPGDSSAPR